MKSRLLFIATVVLALPAATASAQRGQDAALVGTVRDGSGAIMTGATVTISSPQLIGGAQTVTSDAAGAYRFSFLPPGGYDIVAALDGFSTMKRTGILLQPGLTFTVDLTLTVAGVREEIDVNAASPVVDVRASSAPVLIDPQLLGALPLPRVPASGASTVADAVNLAPGVVQSVALGGTFLANPLVIDGAIGSEPGYGQPIVNPNIDWLDQLQVVTVGADAQYGGYTGALVNAITRSGSNHYSGLSTYWTTRPAWTANNRAGLTTQLQDRFRPVQIDERWDGDGQIGGPIVHDRLWFFGGGERYKDSYWPTTFAAGSITANDPKYDVSDRRFIGKLTAAVTPGVRLEAMVTHVSHYVANANAGPLVAPEALAIVDQPETVWNAHLLWTIDSRKVLEVRYGGHDFTQNSGPPASRLAGPPPHSDLVTGVLSDNVPQFSNGHDRPMSTAAHFTWFANGRPGTHEFKTGVEYTHATLTTSSGYVGGELFRDQAGNASEVVFWSGATNRPTQSTRTLYGQDAWTPTPRLTLNIGARLDVYRGSVPEHDDAFANHSFSPRLGAAFDVTSDHRTVLRAHYGRYAEALVTSYYDFLDPLSQAPVIYDAVVAPNQFVEEYRTPTGAQSSIDPRLRFPYSAEYFAGLDRELPFGLSARLQYISRDFRDAIAFTDPGRIWVPVTGIDPGPDGRRGTADDVGPITVYYDKDSSQSAPFLTNPAAYRRYHGMQLIGARRASRRGQFQVSYTWSRTVGNYNNAAYSNAANQDLGIGGVFANPNNAVNVAGVTPQNFTHDFKVLGTYRIDRWGGLTVGGVYRFQSGRPWARSASGFGTQTEVGSIFVEPRGTRELDALKELDLHIEKSWWPSRKTTSVGAFIDAFNVTNQGVALRINNVSGPNFALPTQWLDPRSVRAGLHVNFDVR